MFRIVSLVIGLGAVSYAAYYFLTHGQFAQQPDGRSGAASTLDQVRARTHSIEQQEQQRANDDLKVGTDAEQQ